MYSCLLLARAFSRAIFFSKQLYFRVSNSTNNKFILARALLEIDIARMMELQARTSKRLVLLE
ncbi:hypothetical protein D1627_15245 [Pontibacter oryzae]|uniref:Uncharacterized protein n=1 Tax=Pontibacter oryzae TaxID=2304593 RepID=A0A399RWT5_9BACT|nr:hypothetical protein D1627_15245 [Pontibacter oryzae]